MNAKKILISGASIAGPTLAFWLARYGFEVTVVERSAGLRLGGQNIDVNGPGRKIAQKMGIEQQIRAANTTEIGLQFVNRHNRVMAAFPQDDTGSFTSELEILRGDLVEILYENSKNNVAYQFSDFITGLVQSADGVNVTFKSGTTAVFDLVIAADGVRSKTRELMFGDEVKFKYLGLYTAYLTIPKKETDTRWARWYTAAQSRVFLFRPDNKGTTRASFGFLSPDKGYEKLSPEEKKNLLKQKLAHAGWEAARITDELETNTDVYFDAVTQVKAPRWTNGRLAMIGDAAYCPTPITGMGTTLAITGAYILAGELARNETYQPAFAAYEQQMRPYVKSAQALPPGVPRIAYPKTKLGVAIINRLAQVASSKVFKLITKLFKGKKKQPEREEITLPDYDRLLQKYR